jgi:hypothetical protein
MPKPLKAANEIFIDTLFFLVKLARATLAEGFEKAFKAMAQRRFTIPRRLCYAINSSFRVCSYWNGDPLRRPLDEWLQRYFGREQR